MLIFGEEAYNRGWGFIFRVGLIFEALYTSVFPMEIEMNYISTEKKLIRENTIGVYLQVYA